MFRVLAFILILPGAWSSVGQIASLSGPVSGIVYDAPSRNLRPVVGFPGSSYLGQPLLMDLDAAFVAPDGDSALVVEKTRVVLVRGLRGGSLTKSTVPDLAARIDHLSWGSNSTSLVIHSSAARSLQRFDIGTVPPTAGSPVDLSSIEGDVTGVATNHDASQTVIGFRHPTQGGFYAVREGTPAWMLSSTTDPGPAIFARSSNELYAADRATSQILRFAEGISGSGEVLRFLGETESVTNLVGIAISPGGQRLYVAGGAGRMVREYDLRSRTLLREFRVDIVLECLSPIDTAGSVFVLTRRTSREQPAWLLNVRGVPGVSFVPAGE